jgi:WASH complex subunit 7
MIRNASLKDNSNLVKFFPQCVSEGKFEDTVAELGVGGETLEATKMFDQSVSLLFKQAEDAADYLRVLVDNFLGVFDGENFDHLRLFYLIIPPLTLNYIEHVQRSKEKLFRRNNKDCFISDDGFPLGIAYLLKVLAQEDLFNGLNWFKSMQAKLKKD